jgi:hypothetical protein
MKVYSNPTKPASTIHLTVEDPLTGRNVYRVSLSRSEARESVEYLRTHNGSAPEFVHRFIDAMEIALELKVRR